jgi:hypothetical protein
LVERFGPDAFRAVVRRASGLSGGRRSVGACSRPAPTQRAPTGGALLLPLAGFADVHRPRDAVEGVLRSGGVETPWRLVERLLGEVRRA